MRIQYVMAVAIAGLVAVATPAAAQSGTDRRWSVSFEGGVTRGVKGNVLPYGVGNLGGLPTVIDARTYAAIYGTGFQFSAALGRRVSDRGEVRGRFVWSRLEGRRSEVGTRGTVLFSKFFADVDQDSSLGVDAGYRHYLTSGGKIQPFIGGTVGFVRVNAINADFEVTAPIAPFALADVNVYGSSTVPTAGFSGGVLLNLSDAFAVYGGLDLRWRGSLTMTDPGLESLGFKGGPARSITNPAPPPATLLVPPVALSRASRGWSLPVSAGIHLRF